MTEQLAATFPNLSLSSVLAPAENFEAHAVYGAHVIDFQSGGEVGTILASLLRHRAIQPVFVPGYQNPRYSVFLNGEANTGLLVKEVCAGRHMLTAITFCQELSTEDGERIKFGAADESLVQTIEFTREKPLQLLSTNGKLRDADPEAKDRFVNYLRAPLLPLYVPPDAIAG